MREVNSRCRFLCSLWEGHHLRHRLGTGVSLPPRKYEVLIRKSARGLERGRVLKVIISARPQAYFSTTTNLTSGGETRDLES